MKALAVIAMIYCIGISHAKTVKYEQDPVTNFDLFNERDTSLIPQGGMTTRRLSVVSSTSVASGRYPPSSSEATSSDLTKVTFKRRLSLASGISMISACSTLSHADQYTPRPEEPMSLHEPEQYQEIFEKISRKHDELNRLTGHDDATWSSEKAMALPEVNDLMQRFPDYKGTIQQFAKRHPKSVGYLAKAVIDSLRPDNTFIIENLGPDAAQCRQRIPQILAYHEAFFGIIESSPFVCRLTFEELITRAPTEIERVGRELYRLVGIYGVTSGRMLYWHDIVTAAFTVPAMQLPQRIDRAIAVCSRKPILSSIEAAPCVYKCLKENSTLI